MQNHQTLISIPAIQGHPCPNWPGIAKITRQALAGIQSQGARHYLRNITLPRFLPLAALQATHQEPEITQAIIAALQRLLRIERARRGHWTYDLNRHIGLSQALQAELAQVRPNAKMPP